MAALAVWAKAPDFTLKTNAGDTLRLQDLLQNHRHVVLAFYPAAWSPPCGDEVAVFQEALGELRALGAGIVGLSVDNTWSNQAWAEAKGITFPLLSDFHPKGAVAEQYGVLREDGITERALFLVDAEGTIRYSYVSPILENPGAAGVLEALRGL